MEDEKLLRDEMAVEAMYLLDKASKVEPGTEEHSRIIEDIVKLSKACVEDYKVESEMFNQNLKIEYENKRSEEEIKVKQSQIDLEEKKHTTVKADNILMMGGFALLTIGACAWEITGGRLIPGKVLQFANYIPKIMKV